MRMIPRAGIVVEPLSGDLGGAKEALDRVSIPQGILDRIAETILPRSSLIISDEMLSSETGQGTGFVVLLSGEPQGGIKNRRRGPEVEVRYRRPGGVPSLELRVRWSIFYLVSRIWPHRFTTIANLVALRMSERCSLLGCH
jgi:hypothetical protein